MAMTSADSRNMVTTESSQGSKTALPMVITLFFLWGFITCLNDILIPHLKSLFTLNYAEVMLVQTFFFTGYFVFALPSGKVIDWIGYKWTMVAGLLVMAVGALCFIPAAMVPSFPLFLVSLGILAAGMTFLQVAANPYVIVLGPAKTASSRLNLAQAFNSLGTTVAPYIGSLFILGTVPLAASQLKLLSPAAMHAYKVAQASVVKLPYTLIAIILISFAVAMAFYKLPKIRTGEDDIVRRRAAAQHLETAPPGAGHCGDFRLCRGGGFHWKFSYQLSEPARDRRHDGEGGGFVCGVLLGRRHGGPVPGGWNHAEIACGTGLGSSGDCCVLPGHYVDGHVWACGHVEHYPGGTF